MDDWRGIPVEYQNAIVTGDARVLAERIPPGAAALAFCDPPYWVGFDYGHATDRSMDYVHPEWLTHTLKRIAPVACITPGIANVWDYPKADWILGWFKFGSTGRNTFGGFNVWEPVLVYGTPTGRVWQDAINLPFAPNLARNGNTHACPKPERLMRWLVGEFTERGDIVIDLMCGSGMLPSVCKMLGRRYVAFEIDPDTAERARERVLYTQPPLFVPQEEQAELWTA